jgi:hypothetical protein
MNITEAIENLDKKVNTPDGPGFLINISSFVQFDSNSFKPETRVSNAYVWFGEKKSKDGCLTKSYSIENVDVYQEKIAN